MESRNVIQDNLKSFFAQEILEGQDQGLNEATPLLDHGLLDSMTLMKLVTYLRQQYSISVPARELTPDNLRNLVTLSDLVIRIRGQL